MQAHGRKCSKINGHIAKILIFKIPSSSKMKISVRLGLIMAPVCLVNVSSCRKRENDSVFSSKSSLLILTSKHSLRGPAVGDPTLLGILKKIESVALNSVKSLPASKHCIIIMYNFN